MSPESDIAITIKFTEATNFPAALISGVIDTVEKVVFEVEQEELEYLIREYLGEEPPGIQSLVADACRHRIRTRRGQSVFVESAADGSIVLDCVLSGLAVCILKQTLGEKIKESWLDSPIHHRLKEFLSRERTWKMEQFAQRLERGIRAPRRLKEFSSSIRVEISEAGGISRIAIIVAARSETQLRR
ncbi:MAG: hypothetical protein C5B58_14860 [Acidobacteria bacterium]|nr:MAG: hypothetical protein C5B58_14860 [Acidobacteriota bacterium]